MIIAATNRRHRQPRHRVADVETRMWGRFPRHTRSLRKRHEPSVRQLETHAQRAGHPSLDRRQQLARSADAARVGVLADRWHTTRAPVSLLE
jgi:hypothetical protein